MDTDTGRNELISLDIFQDFQLLTYRLFGLNLGIASADINQGRLMTPRSKMNPFCLSLQSRPEGLRRCRQCDHEHLRASLLSGAPACYVCHAGLFEFVYPIRVKSKVVAIMQCGQVLDRRPSETGWRQIVERLRGCGIGETDLRKKWFRTRIVSPEQNADVFRLLRLFAGYVAAAHETLKLMHEGTQSLLVRKAKDFLQQNWDRDIALEDVAKAVGTSPRNLTRRFRHETKTTVLDSIRRIRLAQACEQLALTQKGIAEIAFQCGFGSIQQFNRLFLKTEGRAPRDWRKAYWNSEDDDGRL